MGEVVQFVKGGNKEGSASKQDKLAAFLKQYREVKRGYMDSILLYRHGDFYEIFFEDAIAASMFLGLRLIKKSNNETIPLCGLSWHSSNERAAKLVKIGYKVAFCEVSEGYYAEGVPMMKVTRVMTPGLKAI